MLAIETTGLTRSFSGKRVVRDVALQVPEGCVYGFLGPNGAGKTTVMRLLLGLLRPDAGSIRLHGRDLGRERLAILASVGAFIESPALYDHLSGRANLDIPRRLLGLPASEVDRVLEVVEMRHAARKKVRQYSLGMRQRLALARTLLGSPRLLLLDEPTNGLDPDGIAEMRQLVRELPARIAGTVFVSSHLLGEVEQVADRAGLMRQGELLVQGPLAELLGSGERLRFAVDDAARAEARLAAAGISAKAGEAGDVLVEIPPLDDEVAFAAQANRLLVEAGVAVSAIAPQQRSLEQLYRDTLARPEERIAA